MIDYRDRLSRRGINICGVHLFDREIDWITIERNMNAILETEDLSSQGKAYRFLKAAILNLEFKANERLRAQDLASRLNLSRTPVREALGRLEQEQLVVRDGGWGYSVRTISFKEAMDVYKVREALEVEAAKEAIDRIDGQYLEQLESYLKRAEDKLSQGKVKEFRFYNKAFHNCIATITGNGCLQSMLNTIDDRVRLLGAMIIDRHVDRQKEALQENREILSALRRGDRTRTSRCGRERRGSPVPQASPAGERRRGGRAPPRPHGSRRQRGRARPRPRQARPRRRGRRATPADSREHVAAALRSPRA